MATLSHLQLTNPATDSTCSPSSPARKVQLHQHKRMVNSAQPKTLLLSFLLVSCLISINCASYGREPGLSGLQQWRNPEYGLLAPDNGREETGRSLDDLVSRLTERYAQKQPQQTSVNTADQQFERYYYGLPNDPSHHQQQQQPESQYVGDYNRRLIELLAGEKDLEQQQQQQQQQQHIDISSPLYLLLDRSRDQQPSGDDSIAFGQKRLEPEAQTGGAARAADSPYQLVDEAETNGLDVIKQQTEDEEEAIVKGGNHSNFTTLLEDDESDNKSSARTSTTPSTTTTSPTTSTRGTTSAEGRGTSDSEGHKAGAASNDTKTPLIGGSETSRARSADKTSLSSVLSNFYAKLSAYLPFKHSTEQPISSTTGGSGSAKLSVSDSAKKTNGYSTNDANNQNGAIVLEDTKPVNDKELDVEDKSGSGQVFSVRITRPHDEPHISLMRKSSLDLPVSGARDEPIHQVVGSPSTIVRQYKYLPDRALLYTAGAEGSGQEGVYEARPYSRHLQPGDDVYGSYRSTMFNVARPGEQPLSLQVAQKSNDVYFLAMVSAFCAMAMAVVLAAGLFAYRIQQNRKMTSETEYPTYGVVGPNNKCGAGAFVGGYFAGNTAGGSISSSGSGKAGSAKHLADMYSNASDSGLTHSSSKSSGSKRALACDQISSQVSGVSGGSQTGGANGGASRGDFLASNQNAARMYHYQHQKQQMIISDRGSNGRHTSASDLDSDEENDDGSYTVYECPGLASAHEMEIKNPLFNDDRTP